MNPLCIVVGVGEKIGSAVARKFASEGHDLALVARNKARLTEFSKTLAAFKTTANIYPADTAQPDQIDTVLQQITNDFAKIDIVIYNAASFSRAAIIDTPQQEWHDLLAVNLLGAMYWCQQVVPIMQQRGQGTIILTSTGAAIRPFRFSPAYGATKAALRMAGLSLAEELKPRGIQ